MPIPQKGDPRDPVWKYLQQMWDDTMMSPRKNNYLYTYTYTFMTHGWREEKAQNHPKSSKIIQKSPMSWTTPRSFQDRHFKQICHIVKSISPYQGMRCHDFQAGDPETTLEAGGSFDATWTMEAGHPGDCYFYLSSTAGIGWCYGWQKEAWKLVMACWC